MGWAMTINSQTQSGLASVVPRSAALMPATRCLGGAQTATSVGLLGRTLRRPRDPERATALIGEAGTLEMMGTLVSFRRGAQFYGERDPAEYLYRLASGVARAYRMTSEGRRQVVAFYVPGDLFGFELDGNHSFSVEAVSNAKVRMIKLSALPAIGAVDQAVSDELRISLARELRRNQDHIRRLGQTAPARVASFLLEIAQRIPNGGTIDLVMSRQDIADYLGLTIETISRTLTHMKRAGAVMITRARRITICNPSLLARMSSGSAD
jgi:CRP/FNR family nitrogen fixation transcriptional regulator